MNKTGSIFDWFFIIMILFMTGICVFVAHIIITNDAVERLFETEGVDNVTVNSKNAILNFDNMLMFVIVGLSLFVLISAALIFSHVAMFIISFFLLCIAVAFAAIVSNTFWDFSNSALISTTATAFPKITFLMDHLPLYIAFMGVCVLVVSYIAYTNQ